MNTICGIGLEVGAPPTFTHFVWGCGFCLHYRLGLYGITGLDRRMQALHLNLFAASATCSS